MTSAQQYYTRPLMDDRRHVQIENEHEIQHAAGHRVILRHLNHYGYIIETEHWSDASVQREQERCASMGMTQL